MSLLMDALKKAEEEKKQAALDKEKQGGTEKDEEVVDKTAETAASATTQSAIAGQEKRKEDKDSWAFDTGELELEPLAKVVEDKTTTLEMKSDLDEDQTIADQSEVSTSPEDTDPTIRTGASIPSDFDHDATLPSERAIQSSLKDYFDASQSIAMERSEVERTNAFSNTGQGSFTTPLDTSATHVTAHTIFTAGNTTKTSTGIGKMALFATLFLLLGLGAVAAYYYTLTPSTNLQMTPPSVARVVENETVTQPQVDVTTAVQGNTTKTPEVVEPNTTKVIVDDPVLAEVVEEIIIPESTTEVSEAASSDVEQKLAVIDETTKSSLAPSSSEVIDPSVKAPAVTPEITSKNEPEQQLEEQSPPVSEKYPEYVVVEEKPFHQVQQFPVQSTQAESPVLAVPVSSEEFREKLKMPKQAIKITHVHAKKSKSAASQISAAYQAYQAGRYLEAKTAYRKVLEGQPTSRDAHLGLAAIAIRENSFETAYRHYAYLSQQDPKDPVVKAALFNMQNNAGGQVNESELKLMLDQSPENSQLHFSLGSFYARQARWGDAQQSFFEAFSADDTNPDYAYNLAVSLDQMEQHKTALIYYRKALELANDRKTGFDTSKVLARIQKLSSTAKG